MAQLLSDVLRIMRLALGRRNENDPDQSDSTMLEYIQTFVNLTMTDDVKLFEQFDVVTFNIDTSHPDGVYTFNDVGITTQFSNISIEALVSRNAPVGGSISWNKLRIYQSPLQFFAYWGFNNENILIPGFPTEMLYYGTTMTFRTIPDDIYLVQMYGYKIIPEFTTVGDPQIPFDYWLRYIAYGAAMNYARDYRFDPDARQMLERDFAHERKLLLTRTYNQQKLSRGMPRF